MINFSPGWCARRDERQHYSNASATTNCTLAIHLQQPSNHT